MAFYLLKRVGEQQFTIGDEIMVLADFSAVPAGTKGKIVEIYDGGVMVEWNDGKDRFRPLRDGFFTEELEYLAVKTNKHPKVL